MSLWLPLLLLPLVLRSLVAFLVVVLACRVFQRVVDILQHSMISCKMYADSTCYEA